MAGDIDPPGHSRGDSPDAGAPDARAADARAHDGRAPDARAPDTGAPEARAADARAADGDTEPDARFTFANERTFLAWARTALAFVVAGLGVVQLLPPFPGVPWGRHLLGVPLIALGAVISVAGYTEWASNQRALRRGEPLPQTMMPRILAVTITVMAVVSAVVVLLSAVLKR